MNFSLKMDFVLSQGVKCIYLLNRRPVCSVNLLSFLHKYPEVATYGQIQYFDKYRDNLCTVNNFDTLSNQNIKRLKSGHLTYRLNTVQYSTLSKLNFSTKSELKKDDSDELPQKNETLFQKMKQLAKKYWSVLVPVHIITSLCWASSIYIAIKHGVDIIGLLKSLHVSEKYINILQKSNAGDWAFTYAFFKICTPIRYTVTIGLTTACVRYLKHIGYLKNVKKLQPEGLSFTANSSKSTEKSHLSVSNEQKTSPKT